jgi:hypothetical protein
MSESNSPGGAGRVDEPGPYERHERVDQELLREAQAARVDGGDEEVVVPGTNADTIRSARNSFAREAPAGLEGTVDWVGQSQARVEVDGVDQDAGTTMSPEEYLRQKRERNAYRAELMSREEYNRRTYRADLQGSAEINARRTLAKAEAVLRHVELYFDRKDSMNAAQHLADQVIQSPLHGEVLSVLAAIDLFKQGYPGEVS